MDAPKAVKRRKITDKSLPTSLAGEYEDYKLYESLVTAERKLDWTITRKRIELTDAIARTYTTRKTLRVFISHSCHDQTWQNPVVLTDQPPPVDFETGQGIPSWKLKVEGRLLDSDQKFTSLLRGMSIHFNLDPATYPNYNVDWQKPQNYPDQDGFEITRRGDITTNARIALHIAQSPDRYKLGPPLADLLQMKESSRAGAVAALWHYIKINQLQDKADRRMIKADAKLQMVAGMETMFFQHLQEIVDRYLTTADPFVVFYTITVDPEKPTGSRTFDMEIEVDDLVYKSALNTAAAKLLANHASQLITIDDEIANSAQSIRNAKLRQEFFADLAFDPRQFVLKWITSQSKDLDLVLGNEHGVREEDLKNSDFFRMDWVDDAVSIHEGLRVATALQKLHENR